MNHTPFVGRYDFIVIFSVAIVWEIDCWQQQIIVLLVMKGEYIPYLSLLYALPLGFQRLLELLVT